MEGSFAWLSEYDDVKDKSKWNSLGNLNTTTWKPLAIYVISCITSDIYNPKQLVMKLLLVLSASTFVYVKWVSYLALSMITKEVSVLFDVMLNSWSEEQNVWTWSLIVFSSCSHDWFLPQADRGEHCSRREAWRCFLEMSFSREDELEECCGSLTDGNSPRYWTVKLVPMTVFRPLTTRYVQQVVSIRNPGFLYSGGRCS